MKDLEAEGWELVDVNAFTNHVGPILRREVDGWPEFAMRTDARHANMRGIVHGGALMTFLDLVLGATVFEHSGGKPNVTVQMDTRFMSAAELGTLLVGRCDVDRAGGSLYYVSGLIRADGQPVASATGVWKIMRPRAPAEAAAAPS